MIKVNRESDIATIELADGKVNAMNIEWCREFSMALKVLADDMDVKAVVLTSGEQVFSAGVDLKRVVVEPVSYVQPFIDALSRCFRDAFSFPKPLVVAINGHAIAGGCIVASCGDVRVATNRARIGLPEMRVGVPLPPIAVEVVRRVTTPFAFQSMLNTGANFRGESAVAVGLADEIVLKDELLEVAKGHAAKLASMPLATFQIMKRMLREPYVSRADQLEIAFGDNIRAIWNSPEVKAAVKTFAEKL